MGEEPRSFQSCPSVAGAGEGNVLQNITGGLGKAHITELGQQIPHLEPQPPFVLETLGPPWFSTVTVAPWTYLSLHTFPARGGGQEIEVFGS